MSNVYAILHHPPGLSQRSGMYPLAEAVGATSIFYERSWERLQEKSWTLGSWLRAFGNAYYGTAWNALVPVRDELRFLRAIPRGPAIAHFLWGEFASPRWGGLFRRKGARLIGTFHASARRQPAVFGTRGAFRFADRITLMSKSQMPFFVEQAFPEERIRVILHGVDTKFFSPGGPKTPSDGPLKGLLIGKTERDHEFMAGVLRKLPAGILDLAVATAADQRELYYAGVPNVRFLPRLEDQQLVEAYRAAELLIMPMLDCAANNVVLEAMACGTPVMINRVGGVPEYVAEDGNFIMDRKEPDEWVDRIVELARNKERVCAKAPQVRRWAEQLSWTRIAAQYRSLYDEALES